MSANIVHIVRNGNCNDMNLIEVVIINWKRPRNVERIIDALREQTIPCTITICDNHPDPEFALSPEALDKADRIYRWKHNLGAYSRYLPLAGMDHQFTFLLDDDLLPGKRCLEAYLRTALQLEDFGVLGHFGRIVTPSGFYKYFNTPSQNRVLECDFIIRAYFVKTCNLSRLVDMRWELGYFEDEKPEDDLLMCGAMKYYRDLRCYVIPTYDDPETLLNPKGLETAYALSRRPDHIFKRNMFIRRLRHHGWKPIYETGRKHLQTGAAADIKFDICIKAGQSHEYLADMLDRLMPWKGCRKIVFTGIVTEKTTRWINRHIRAKNKIIYLPGPFGSEKESLDAFAKEVTGSHILILQNEEAYTEKDLDNLYEDALLHPEVDLFVFDTYENDMERIYRESADALQQREISPDILRQRIYRWRSGTRFSEASGCIPVYPDGQQARFDNYTLNTMFTRAAPKSHSPSLQG